jgi:hypothetical protein
LFVLLYFFFWPLCCLFFFDIRILITHLVSSNSSFILWVKVQITCPKINLQNYFGFLSLSEEGASNMLFLHIERFIDYYFALLKSK